MTITTKRVQTGGLWAKVTDLLGISMTDNTSYSVQVIGTAKVSYSNDSNITGYFLLNSPQPFTYNKVSGEDFYINAYDATLTIGE
ncbi:MAG: hypothetical protein IKH36_01765 [Bacilli bacterium]|nr:hypothetical protein [Bacilli bacterium]